jgi:hypothetical protein
MFVGHGDGVLMSRCGQIYSEDLITKCFGVIDLSLSSVILPFADAVASPACEFSNGSEVVGGD